MQLARGTLRDVGLDPRKVSIGRHKLYQCSEDLVYVLRTGGTNPPLYCTQFGDIVQEVILVSSHCALTTLCTCECCMCANEYRQALAAA